MGCGGFRFVPSGTGFGDACVMLDVASAIPMGSSKSRTQRKGFYRACAQNAGRSLLVACPWVRSRRPRRSLLNRKSAERLFPKCKMPKCRRKRSEPNLCDLPGCERKGEAVPCCSKRLCDSCSLSLLRVCLCGSEPRFCATCPFCREECEATLAMVKHCMATCQSHAKIAYCCGEKQDVAIAHRPCEHGCYDCPSSEIVVKAL